MVGRKKVIDNLIFQVQVGEREKKKERIENEDNIKFQAHCAFCYHISF